MHVLHSFFWLLMLFYARYLSQRTTSAFVVVSPTTCVQRCSSRVVSFLSSDTYTTEQEISPPQPLKEIVRLRGPVDSGYGRGGKKLGFPTANLPSSRFASALDRVDTGVYFGWALIEDPSKSTNKLRNTKLRAVVNVGYSPTFEGQENKEKIVEAHLMLEESQVMSDFYNETMRLSLIGFLRNEQKFPSFPDLVAAIHEDVRNAKDALEVEPFVSLRSDTFFSQGKWVGDGGGDSTASWEFQDMEDALKLVP